MALPLAAAISQPPSANDNELHYVDCAFDVPLKKEAFLFTGNQCLQFNYAAPPNDHVIKGPLSIGDFFPSLKSTTFAQGIDSAFTSSVENEVYMFKKDLCVLLNFDSGKIIEEPIEITNAFTSLKGTVFEDGIDAAFASHQGNKAYIFNGNQYAVIKFTDGSMVTTPQAITNGFPFLSSIGFAKGLDAAFRSSTPNQAYIFKDDAYAIINYAQGATSNGIIQKVSPISASDGFLSLRDIIPSRS